MKQYLKVILLTAVSSVLISCNGGGGGSSASGGSPVVTTGYAPVADTTPVEGSVIQYVRAKDISNIGITAASNGNVTFDNIFNGVTNFTLANTDHTFIGLVNRNGISTSTREYRKALPNNQTLGARIVTYSPNGSAEHITGGIWVENFSINSALGDVGIFVDGGTKFDTAAITALTGTKTYTGIAGGYYHDTEFSDNEPLPWETTNAVITVDFGTASQRGTITARITAIDTSDPANFTVTPGAFINLQAAAIGGEEGGFTTGDTLAGATGGSIYGGKWGSQFYYTETPSGQPKYIAGTLGGTGRNSVSNNGTFIGAFIARE